MTNRPTALVTGAARRIGAAISRHLHEREIDLVLHCSSSIEPARKLASELNNRREGSAVVVQADLREQAGIAKIVDQTRDFSAGLDLLVNNASVFYPTPVGKVDNEDYSTIFSVNVLAPFNLVQQLIGALRHHRGCVVNITDIYADRPLESYSLYSASKAALLNLSRGLALELAPDVRVNAVAPGAILWPEDNAEIVEERLKRIPMACAGDPTDIAKAVVYLAFDAPYVTGQVINVDGGRSINP